MKDLSKARVSVAKLAAMAGVEWATVNKRLAGLVKAKDGYLLGEVFPLLFKPSLENGGELADLALRRKRAEAETAEADLQSKLDNWGPWEVMHKAFEGFAVEVRGVIMAEKGLTEEQKRRICDKLAKHNFDEARKKFASEEIAE
jgi:hypothetical protein